MRLLSIEELHAVHGIELALTVAGTLGSIWMVQSLKQKLKSRNQQQMESSILYRLLLLIALADSLGGFALVMYKMCFLFDPILFKHPASYESNMTADSGLTFYILQIAIVAVLSSLLSELMLVVQILLLAKYDNPTYLNFHWICGLLVVPSFLRVVIAWANASDSGLLSGLYNYFDLPGLAIFEFLTVAIVLYLFCQSLFGTIKRYKRALIHRIMMFPVVYLICTLPKFILYVVLASSRQEIPRQHPLFALVDILGYSFTLANCLAYGASQRCCSRQKRSLNNVSLNILVPIDPKKIEIDMENRLGVGAFGAVYKGTYRRTPVAIKILNLPTVGTTVEGQQSFFCEAATLNSLVHPNIVYFMGAYINEDKGYIVCEYCSSGSLRDVIRHFDRLGIGHGTHMFQWKLKIALGIARGLNYLHQLRILHRDLKSPNILIADYNVAKVADFGTAKLFSSFSSITGSSDYSEDHLHTTRVGTVRWTAPEILLNFAAGKGEYDTAADVYSFGIVLWELLTFQLPFSSTNFGSKIHQLVISGERPEIPHHNSFPQEYVKLVQACWYQSPEERPTMTQIIEQIESFHWKSQDESEQWQSDCVSSYIEY